MFSNSSFIENAIRVITGPTRSLSLERFVNDGLWPHRYASASIMMKFTQAEAAQEQLASEVLPCDLVRNTEFKFLKKLKHGLHGTGMNLMRISQPSPIP